MEYVKIGSLVGNENRIQEAMRNFQSEVERLVREKMQLSEVKLRKVMTENETLHRERLVLSREIQRLRSEKKAILELLGVKGGGDR